MEDKNPSVSPATADARDEDALVNALGLGLVNALGLGLEVVVEVLVLVSSILL